MNIDQGIIDKMADILSKFQELYPPTGVPNPETDPQAAGQRTALLMMYQIYMTNPELFKTLIGELVFAFEEKYFRHKVTAGILKKMRDEIDM